MSRKPSEHGSPTLTHIHSNSLHNVAENCLVIIIHSVEIRVQGPKKKNFPINFSLTRSITTLLVCEGKL